MPTLVIAGVSVRGLAQAAARDGFEAIALDCFGDLDTRRAAAQWLPIGTGACAPIDAERLLEALRAIAAAPGREPIGWIAGSGLEGLPDVLARGAAILPLLGTPAEAVRRVREPATFFATLAAHTIAHPPVRWHAAPADEGRWLRKDAAGCGGWHIRVAGFGERVAPGGGRYFQREVAGTPMSATFIANGRGARVVGVNELIVRRRGAHPHVFHGCVGPVPVASVVARRIDAAVQTLVAAFALRGWCSLDVVVDGDAVQVLEVNPRPPASLALYAARGGLIDAHLRACLHAELPARDAFLPARVAGFEIVFAPRAFTLGERAARDLAESGDVHDLPAAGTHFDAGDPVCSVGAHGAAAAPVHTALRIARDALQNVPETTP